MVCRFTITERARTPRSMFSLRLCTSTSMVYSIAYWCRHSQAMYRAPRATQMQLSQPREDQPHASRPIEGSEKRSKRSITSSTVTVGATCSPQPKLSILVAWSEQRAASLATLSPPTISRASQYVRFKVRSQLEILSVYCLHYQGRSLERLLENLHEQPTSSVLIL